MTKNENSYLEYFIQKCRDQGIHKTIHEYVTTPGYLGLHGFRKTIKVGEQYSCINDKNNENI